MARILSAALLSLFVAMSAQAQDSDFPQGPAILKDAEASGLQRLSAAQLKTLFPGKSVVAGAATGKSMRTFNADGTLERQMLKTVYIPQSAICTPQSKQEVTLCYGSWKAPKGEKLKRDQLRVVNDGLEKTFQEGKYG